MKCWTDVKVGITSENAQVVFRVLTVFCAGNVWSKRFIVISFPSHANPDCKCYISCSLTGSAEKCNAGPDDELFENCGIVIIFHI